jgi:ATP-dependent DNA helicase RecG
MNLDLESYIKEIENILRQKDKNIKSWDDIYPSFISLSKKNASLIKINNMEEDIKKILSYVKPLGILDTERKNKRLKGLKDAVLKLKEKYLVDSFEESVSKYSLFTDIKYVKNVGTKRASYLKKLGIENI